METISGSSGRELRQVLRDLLELQVRGGVNGETLLLLLCLVNTFGVIDLLWGRQSPAEGEGQFLGRLLGTLMFPDRNPGRTEDGEGAEVGLRGIPGGKIFMNLLGGKDGLKALAALLNNKEIMESVLPLLQRLGSGSTPVKNSGETGKDSPLVRKGPTREVIRWDFGRSNMSRDKDDAG